MGLISLALEELKTERVSPEMRVSIVGVGGAGTNLLSQAITSGLNPKNCVAVNTDRNRLSESLASNKVLLGDSVDTDRGWTAQRSGSVQVLAHRVAPFTRESDFTILLTGLGGVTGTIAAPAIAQLNRNQVRPVVSVVALPFIHERERRFVALRGLKRMVDACDCTVVIDNAVQFDEILSLDRRADETACLAVKSLSEIVAMGHPAVTNKLLRILSLGRVATACTARVNSSDRIQSAIIKALERPSANLPLSKAMGAVLIFRGTEPMNAGETALAYEAVASLIGHDVEFAQISVRSAADPLLLVLLSGYSYGACLGAFVDLIEDLYDMEYGIERGCSEIGLPSRLYQMEGF
jgi:cell division protein FtsZ